MTPDSKSRTVEELELLLIDMCAAAENMIHATGSEWQEHKRLKNEAEDKVLAMFQRLRKDVERKDAALEAIFRAECRCGIGGPCGCGERMREIAEEELTAALQPQPEEKKT